MSQTLQKCPKCEGQMNSGFVTDRTQPGPERFAMRFRPSFFYEGELKYRTSDHGGNIPDELEVEGLERSVIRAMRCTKCRYLEFYTD